MKANLKKIRKKRKFSEAFKKQLVKEFESGKYSVPELGKLHRLGYKLIYNWIYKYSNYNEKGYRIIEMKESSEKKFKDMESRVKELEGIVGRKQIMIDYLEKMIDIAKDELDIDIKKNFDTLQPNGSKKTEKK